MSVKYEIANCYDLSTTCNYCGGSGVQSIGAMGYRGCQYCITGYKVRNCAVCHGQGCTSCVGTKHEFHSELSSGTSVALPDTPSRTFAGERPPAAARLMPRR